jgi:hypothetical protein
MAAADFRLMKFCRRTRVAACHHPESGASRGARGVRNAVGSPREDTDRSAARSAVLINRSRNQVSEEWAGHNSVALTLTLRSAP